MKNTQWNILQLFAGEGSPAAETGAAQQAGDTLPAETVSAETENTAVPPVGEESGSNGHRPRNGEETLRRMHSAFRQHFAGLERQAEELKQVYPDFDLRRQLRDPVFARLVRPDVGLSLKEAYHARHHEALQAAAMEAAVRTAARKLTLAFRSGAGRPQENGAGSQAASVSTFDYRTATPEQRNTLKKRIREAAAKGEKIYPG